METRKINQYDTSYARDMTAEEWNRILEQKPPPEYQTVMGERDVNGIYRFTKREEIIAGLAGLPGVQIETIGALQKPKGEQAEYLLKTIKSHLSSSQAWRMQGHGKEYTLSMFEKLLSPHENYLPEQYEVRIFRIAGNGKDTDPVLCLVGGVDGNETTSTPAALWFIKRCAEGGDLNNIRNNFKEIIVLPMYAPYSVDMGIRISSDAKHSSPTFHNPSYSASTLERFLLHTPPEERAQYIAHYAKLKGGILSQEEIAAISQKISGGYSASVNDERFSEVMSLLAIGPSPEEKFFREFIRRENFQDLVILQLHEKDRDGQTALLLQSPQSADDLAPLTHAFTHIIKKAGFIPGANLDHFPQGHQIDAGVIHYTKDPEDIDMRYLIDITIEAGTPNQKDGEPENREKRTYEQMASIIAVLQGMRAMRQNGKW